MGIIDLNQENIKKLISLKEKNWENIDTTNCYAFALGLDIPERNLATNIYQLGVFYSIMNDVPFYELNMMPYEKRLLLDLKALGIKYSLSSPNENSTCSYNFGENGIESINYYWLISMFENSKTLDFHFLRKSMDGKWWHKEGYEGTRPTKKDKNGNIILDPRDCDLGLYKYKKTYKLSINKRN